MSNQHSTSAENPARTAPRIILDGDMPRCSECGCTEIRATETLTQEYLVEHRAQMPGPSGVATLTVRITSTETKTGKTFRCGECGLTLDPNGYRVRLRVSL